MEKREIDLLYSLEDELDKVFEKDLRSNRLESLMYSDVIQREIRWDNVFTEWHRVDINDIVKSYLIGEIDAHDTSKYILDVFNSYLSNINTKDYNTGLIFMVEGRPIITESKESKRILFGLKCNFLKANIIK